jgi:hypothetical protein
MKKILFLATLLILSSFCFAVDYYAEYSFDEADKISKAEIHGGNGWEYYGVFRWTRTDIQNEINRLKATTGYRRTAADFMSRMLRASTNKRIFVIDTSVQYGPYGFLFLKVNENEYVVFFTGN